MRVSIKNKHCSYYFSWNYIWKNTRVVRSVNDVILGSRVHQLSPGVKKLASKLGTTPNRRWSSRTGEGSLDIATKTRPTPSWRGGRSVGCALVPGASCAGREARGGRLSHGRRDWLTVRFALSGDARRGNAALTCARGRARGRVTKLQSWPARASLRPTGSPAPALGVPHPARPRDSPAGHPRTILTHC